MDGRGVMSVTPRPLFRLLMCSELPTKLLIPKPLLASKLVPGPGGKGADRVEDEVAAAAADTALDGTGFELTGRRSDCMLLLRPRRATLRSDGRRRRGLPMVCEVCCGSCSNGETGSVF